MADIDFTAATVLNNYLRGAFFGVGITTSLTALTHRQYIKREIFWCSLIIGILLFAEGLIFFEWDYSNLEKCILRARIGYAAVYTQWATYWYFQAFIAYTLNLERKVVKYSIIGSTVVRVGVGIYTYSRYYDNHLENGICITSLPVTTFIVDKAAELLFCLTMAGFALYSLVRRIPRGSTNVRQESMKTGMKGLVFKLFMDHAFILVLTLLVEIGYITFVFTSADPTGLSTANTLTIMASGIYVSLYMNMVLTSKLSIVKGGSRSHATSPCIAPKSNGPASSFTPSEMETNNFTDEIKIPLPGPSSAPLPIHQFQARTMGYLDRL